jgi:hypothetical protein
MSTFRRLGPGVVLLAGWLSACSSYPDTPENRVMDYLTSAQVGDKDVDKQLCERLRGTDDDDVLAELDRIVNRASVFGDETEPTRREGETAYVGLRVVFAPSKPGADGDPWIAEVVREGGSWKVCGFSPR